MLKLRKFQANQGKLVSLRVMTAKSQPSRSTAAWLLTLRWDKGHRKGQGKPEGLQGPLVVIY